MGRVLSDATHRRWCSRLRLRCETRWAWPVLAQQYPVPGGSRRPLITKRKRKPDMAQMSILEVLKNTTRYTTTTTFLLLDELRQRLLALKIREQSFPAITQATATPESVP